MKKVFAIFAACLTVMMIAGCASSNISLAEHGPYAVVSVVGNSSLPWVEEKNGGRADDVKDHAKDGIVSNAINKLLDGSNPEYLTAQDRVDCLEETTRRLLEEITGAEVIEKEVVLNSEVYKRSRASYYNALSATTTATDYKDMTNFSGKKARMLCNEIGAKNLILIRADFKKKVVKGSDWNGEIAPFISLKINVLNEKGGTLIRKEYELSYSETVKAIDREYDRDALVALYPDLIDSAIRKFIMMYM